MPQCYQLETSYCRAIPEGFEPLGEERVRDGPPGSPGRSPGYRHHYVTCGTSSAARSKGNSLMIDRTTKLLLALIVLALWALLLRPVLTPVPTQAAAQPKVMPLSSVRFSAPVMLIHPTNGHLYV